MKHTLLTTLVAILFLGAAASGQPAPPEGQGPGMDGPPRMEPGPAPVEGPLREGPPRGGRAEEDLRGLLQSVMMARVSRSLDLSEEQTVILVRRFSEHQDFMMGLRKQRHELMRTLQEAIENGADDATITQKLDALIALDEEAATAPRRLLDAASKGLSAKQRAELYNVLLEFESDLRGMVMRAQQRRGADGPPQGGRGRGGQARGNGGEGGGRNFVPPPRDVQGNQGPKE